MKTVSLRTKITFQKAFYLLIKQLFLYNEEKEIQLGVSKERRENDGRHIKNNYRSTNRVMVNRNRS